MDEKPLTSTLQYFDGCGIAPESVDWLAAKAIRLEVFVGEQACPMAEEFDGHDATSRHLLLREIEDEPRLSSPGDEPGTAIGTARWRTVDWNGEPVAKLERFAVRRSHRGAGAGQQLVDGAIEDARAAGLRRFVLHSQEHLVDFYRAFGFITVGERFIEAGIPHRRMIKSDG
ncbi:MAG: GNAT family N-acetyltransferase [Acidobacteriota bacterium]